MKKSIVLNAHELQSKSTRVNWAEGLIRQLPKDHDGRNSWLLNFGTKPDAAALRQGHNPEPVRWDPATDSAERYPAPGGPVDPIDELVLRFPNQPEFQTDEQNEHQFKIVLFKMGLGLGAIVSFAIWAWIWSH